ncbi:MAG: glycosyltransferase family 4 protein [Mesorhizobium sp.]|nr:glycosyltransferase family 4 protein [Mesorhizobium sp.]MBL8580084.1 glycosyltransferase family 4 protein [Mesorhizobium sp.]
MNKKPIRGPIRLLFIQTQAEMAGAQEISRLLGDGLGRERRLNGEPEFEIHHLFFYRKTSAFDRWRNVHFCLEDSPKGPFSLIAFMSKLVKMIRRIQPDVLLTFQHYGNIFGAPAGRLAGVPVIVANHVSAPATISTATRAIDKALGLMGVYDVITVNSNETWRNYQAYPERYRKHLVHVPHGFEDKSVNVGRQEARAAFGLPAGVPLIGSVARLHPLKQLDAAVEVIARRPALHLAIAGQGPDEARLRTIAQDLGVSDRVHLIGDMPPQKVGLFLAGLNVFVFPSAAETFGLAAVEAAQAGIPVVANDLAVLREVLTIDGEACALFADASNIDDLAAKIDIVFRDHQQAARMVALGRKLAGRYSVESMVDAYAGIIRNALGPGVGDAAGALGPQAAALRLPR